MGFATKSSEAIWFELAAVEGNSAGLFCTSLLINDGTMAKAVLEDLSVELLRSSWASVIDC